MSSVRLRLVSVAKAWPGGGGLRPVSFDVEAGQVVVVRGRSGSGKSTLLAVLAGWCVPDAGTVHIDGDPTDVATAEGALHRLGWSGVAVVPQVLALIPELTVRENVAVVLDGPNAASRSSVRSALERLDVASLGDRFPDEISMGQQQRVAVARALVASPLVLLADEPTSHQDEGHSALVVAALRSCAASGAAVLVASHDDLFTGDADRVIDLQV